jgi:HEAT repeat protein
VLVGPNISGHERALVELAQWIARTVQYSAAHPACQRLGEKAHATLTQALALESPLVVGVLKDDVLVGGVSTRHPAIRTRIGPCLHERGAMVLRLLHGVTLAELTALVEILTLPAQTVFDRGGVLRLAMNAGLARVQVEELGHDVTAEEREAQRRRAKLRSFFKEVLLGLLGRRVVDARIAEHLIELLEHPDIAVTILEEDPAGLAEAAAGLALMVRQEEKRTGLPLAAKLRDVFLRLTPPSRDRVLRGFPSLVDEFRGAMAWSYDGFSEPELARMAAPAVRAHAAELEVVLYALSAAVPHDGTRLSALRLLGLSFFDLPADEAAANEALSVLVRPTPDYDSFRSEREILRPLAEQALVARTIHAAPRPASIPPQADDAGLPIFDGRRPVAEVVGIATRTRSFDRFCEALPAAAEAMLLDGASTAVVGLLRGLASVSTPQWQEAAARALQSVAVSSAARVMGDLDDVSSTVEGAELEELGTMVRLLATLAPASVLERLDVCENRKMRRIMLDALSLAGPTLLPLVTPRLRSDRWFIVRNAVLIVARIGGTSRDLEVAYRHPDFRVRLEVVRALRAMAAEEASMALVAAYLADPADEVRQHARSLLRGELLGDAAIDELERFVLDEAQPEDLRRSAVVALGRCPRDTAAMALFHVLHPQGLIESGGTAGVRDLAAAALRHSPAPGAGGYFEQGLTSSVRRVRKACERAAGGPP